jgi:Transcriptional regulators
MDVFREIFLMQQTYATLFSLANKLQVQGDKYFHGLTSRQFMTIIAIAHLPEDETTIINIARKLGTTKQSVKQLINAMEEKGYITIVPSQKDKRAVNVQITESGKKIAMECSEKGLHLFTDLFRNFTTDEIETLWSLLKKLYSFDGEEQDGFEENVQLEMDEDLMAAQERALKEFVQRRSEKK